MSSAADDSAAASPAGPGEQGATITTTTSNPPALSRSTSHVIADAVHVKTPNARETWGSELDYVLSSMGLAIGLGNVWRFPYLCYQNGGGAFLLPYTLMLLFAGLPLYFMEVALGQYCSSGLIKVWRAVPPMRGLGYGQLFMSVYVSIFYNVVLAYCLYFFFASFTSRLPWIGCSNSWNTRLCSEIYEECIEDGGIVTDDKNCTRLDDLNQDELTYYNVTIIPRNGTYNTSLYRDPFIHVRALPSQEYWKNEVLQESSSMNETGTLVWKLTLCLLLAWVLIFLCLIKGVKSAGKVVYFTATFPFVVIFILLIRAATLEGHEEGVRYYIYPEWERLKHAVIWRDAAVQIFFSLGAGGGGLLTLASYNKFHSNCYRNSVFVAVVNCLTSFISGFMIFSIVGYMAHKLNKSVKDFAHDDLSGFGLVFVACPEALAKFPGAPFWSLMFFFMLILLAVDSQFVGVEVIVTVLIDEFPDILRPRRTLVTGIACFVMFILGLPIVTNAGGYWMALYNNYAVSFVPLVAGILLTCNISYIYGFRRFLDDIRVMIGTRIVDHWHFWFWLGNWLVATPLLLGIVLICHWAFDEAPTYNGMAFPGWATAIGYLMMMTALLCFPAFWVYDFVRKPTLITWEDIRPSSIIQRLKLITRPSISWGPLLAENRLKSWDLHEKRGTTMGGKVDPNARPHEPVIMSRIEEEPDGGAPRTFHYAVFENEPESDVLP
ncbi:sodium- and chloride-dependent neutral and basic amino acid transporter B(0+) isoform X1 [Strongylocentrotus purpuratus]|uniref:Transporter n=1 Tax=Strongylocentrotus purpuratus TaxID=7668 RepID=A0A7M7GKP8_STRPU|nr:sodium- and chloride-dependent neutral and basic amino acid transporter B(0+) isoform X1 [Strongylocentrotus purpuratus]